MASWFGRGFDSRQLHFPCLLHIENLSLLVISNFVDTDRTQKKSVSRIWETPFFSYTIRCIVASEISILSIASIISIVSIVSIASIKESWVYIGYFSDIRL